MANTKSYHDIIMNPGLFRELIEQVRRTGESTVLMDGNSPVADLVSHNQKEWSSLRAYIEEPHTAIGLIEWVRRKGERATILIDRQRPAADLIPHREMSPLEGMPSYPVNYMTMLDNLYNSERWEELHSRFNFFAFMIHDSEAHPDFDREIKARLFDYPDQVRNENDDFDHLYQQVINEIINENDKLMFFALVGPSLQEDRDSNRLPDRDTQDVPELSRSAISLAHSIASIDSSIRAVSLANNLEIPNDKLPCLVITPDLHSKQFIWLRTDLGRLDDQLYQLRKLAYRVQGFGRFGKERIINDYLQHISPSEENGTVYLMGERNFGSALTNVMTVTVAGHSPFAEEKTMAREKFKNRLEDFGKELGQIKSTLRNFRQQLEGAHETVINELIGLQGRIKGSPKSEFEDAHNKIGTIFEDLINKHTENFEAVCEKIDSHLAALTPNTWNLKLKDFKIKEEFLESDSYEKLKVAQAVLDLLNDLTLLKEISLDSLDYSPGVIGLAKVFEREVNLSVVHWVRSDLGIQLPKYFDQVQPSKEAKYSLTTDIDFNREHKESWRPPTMGESLKVCKEKNKKKEMPAEWRSAKNDWEKFLDQWNGIKDIRNDSAHDKSLDETSVKKVKDILNNLANDFEKLYQIKEKYRDRVIINIPDSNLRTVINEALGKPKNGSIDKGDMVNLGSRFYAKDKNICDLTGLKSSSKLTSLFLQGNAITDLMPLENLTDLIVLNLKDNQIKDLTPLMELRKLKNLNLQGNAITDLIPLKNLTDLRQLDLKCNQIRDLTPLVKLGKLKKLMISNNPLNDVSIDQHIPALKERKVNVEF